MLLAMLSRVYDSRRIELPAFLASALNLSVPSLLGVTLGDGGLSSWQGSLPIEAPQVESIIAASGVRTRPQRQARDWGYQRAAAGQTVVVMDAAPPPDRRVARGGCASTLAFELSDGAHRLVISSQAAMTVCHWVTVMAPGVNVDVADLPAEIRERDTRAVSESWVAALEREAGCIHVAVEVGRSCA